MSLQTMPILFLNMGGEMAYILEQRLTAQSVKQDKSSKVMTDIVGTMFSKKFIDELFKSQELYSRRSMRSLFEKLAHSSIMRLNATSMDKLYDLMTMAVKYQLQNCISGKDVLLMTLNHLDGIRKMVQGVANLQTQIDYAYMLVTRNYFELTAFELYMLRCNLLSFYQDTRVKVSMLLRENKQKEDGRFVISLKGDGRMPFGAVQPGTYAYHGGANKGKSATFESAGKWKEMKSEGNLSKTAKKGDRIIQLGINMYKNPQSIETQGGLGSASENGVGGGGTSSEASVKEELKLLSKLIGGNKSKNDDTNFTLNLFDDQDDAPSTTAASKKSSASEATAKSDEKIIKIDASKRDKRSVEKMVGDMNLKEKKPRKPKGEDMLDMMDDAASRPTTASTNRSRSKSATKKVSKAK